MSARSTDSRGRGAAQRRLDLQRRLQEALACPDDDEARLRIEGLASEFPQRWNEPSIASESHLWAPAAYLRNRVRFRPLVAAHFFPEAILQPDRANAARLWSQHATALEPFLAEADRTDDTVVFRRLWSWKNLGGLRSAEERHKLWWAELWRRFQAAANSGERMVLLEKFTMGFGIDADEAELLYRHDARASRSFIRGMLENRRRWLGFREDRSLPARLMDAIRSAGDDDFYYTLYRRTVPIDTWKTDVLALADSTLAGPELVRALEQRHPEAWGGFAGPAFVALIMKRGAEVVPYVLPRLQDVRKPFDLTSGNADLDKLKSLAEERELWVLWAAIARMAVSPKHFDRDVAAVLASGVLDDEERRGRLLLLAGVSRELSLPGLTLMRVLPLETQTAVALYDRYPDLARGPFLPHIEPIGDERAALFERARAAGDEVLEDALTARLLLTAPEKPGPLLGRLAREYEALRDADPAAFARRVARILSRPPAYAILSINHLARRNPLARLILLRGASTWLDAPEAIRDLLESPQIHIQILAFRALALPDPRALTAAAQCIDLLLPVLLRPLHRTTRQLALRALANAARASAEHAARVISRAREALDLPDEAAPHEAVIELLAIALSAHPATASTPEEPKVFQLPPRSR